MAGRASMMAQNREQCLYIFHNWPACSPDLTPI